MANKLHIASASIATAFAVVGIVGIVSFAGPHNQANAQNSASADAMRCYIGAKMDRPDSHMTRGWVCTPEHFTVATN